MPTVSVLFNELILDFKVGLVILVFLGFHDVCLLFSIVSRLHRYMTQYVQFVTPFLQGMWIFVDTLACPATPHELSTMDPRKVESVKVSSPQ